MYHYNWWSIFSETIVCITTITIGNQKDVCTITASSLFLRILTTNYSDTHHRKITVNTREDATEITIPWFNTNLIFLQCRGREPGGQGGLESPHFLNRGGGGEGYQWVNSM